MSIIQFYQQFPSYFIITATIFGLIVGSFLNVLIHRLPIMLDNSWRAEMAMYASEGENIADNPELMTKPLQLAKYNLWYPRSACPHCHALITAWQNIPVLSFLWQKGKCANCTAKISWRYPLIELLGGLIAALAAWHYGFSLKFIVCCLFFWILIALACIDFDTYLLPDQLTLFLLWLGLLVNIDANFVTLNEAVVGAAMGYLSLWSVYWLFRLATGKEGMGYGDFKLLAALGAWLGWKSLLSIILLSSLVGSIVGVTLILLKANSWARPIPFGPYLVVAGGITFIWGEVINRYLFF